MPRRNDPEYPDAPRSSTYEDGIEFEDHVCILLSRHSIVLQNINSKRFQFAIGENLQGFEIKYDARCTGDRGTRPTGRLSIEVAEKSKASNAEWVDSGIYRADTSWLYIQGNYKTLWIFGKYQLQRWHQQAKPATHESFGTVRKVYMPLSVANRICLVRFEGEKMVLPGASLELVG